MVTFEYVWVHVDVCVCVDAYASEGVYIDGCLWVCVDTRGCVCQRMCVYLCVSPTSVHIHTYPHTSTPGVLTICLVLRIFVDTSSYVRIHVDVVHVRGYVCVGVCLYVCVLCVCVCACVRVCV